MNLYSSFVLLVALVWTLDAHRLPRDTPLSTGHFSAKQVGDALTKVDSASDTLTGVTKTGVKGMLANSGKLRGGAAAQSAAGGKTQSVYTGDMQGRGGLVADTRSQAGPLGQASRTELKGFLDDSGSISGSVGTGSQY
ncbi:uncharacterized protein LOC122251393 [Penaeus japonicus]|uniref:uncharacterized protein LOC122251393 n=1 Tax=Penaeus japonicus TaxID=27405 RepID=UPI001C713B22|nr:uncharacterized protein LOC122251393 [Penaeus japonicus]